MFTGFGRLRAQCLGIETGEESFGFKKGTLGQHRLSDYLKKLSVGLGFMVYGLRGVGLSTDVG